MAIKCSIGSLGVTTTDQRRKPPVVTGELFIDEQGLPTICECYLLYTSFNWLM